MKNTQADIFQLENFEGPLDFLLHLIQKSEIDIYSIPLHSLTDQFLLKMEERQNENIDLGAEFVSGASFLHCLKSKTLLPKHEQEENPEDLEPDPRFEIIHQLLDYCRFRDAAKHLEEQEHQQNAYYSRGGDLAAEVRKPLGIEHLSLEDLAALFQQVIVKALPRKGSITEESWKVSDKIRSIKMLLKNNQKIDFKVLFDINMSREELIVTFLAILELMKLGDLQVVREIATNTILILGCSHA